MTESDEKLADCVNKRDETAKELLTKFSKLCDLNNNPMTQAERNCYRWGAEKGWDAGIAHERARNKAKRTEEPTVDFGTFKARVEDL